MSDTKLIIGLTGGIASGKTTVANLFAAHGIDIVDTDQIAYDLVKPGQIAYKKIIDHFGKTILDSNKQLDRIQLRKRIFANTDEKHWLESLLHPLIRQQTKAMIEKSTSPYCIVVIPLLYETWPNPLINRVLVVETDPQQQLSRLKQRDTINTNLAESMIAQQANNQQRQSIADDIVYNNNNPEDLEAGVSKLHNQYLASLAPRA